ncbi:CDP-alcohol phosphatidyltransferase family protein [Rubrivirga sp. S365]|uniref:CDP-alcohol phosphatidyltransferase family protein n=1 Tax=Rubrivirga litoralis TaxID=3075598 RepID=A0ABU3BPH6_9BACT|nr:MULTISPECIES: CDP-alcohol phosphatidyltransferase family protein [unclassified Rubrivirga]MDT0631196.1 CDP-alcohol phosphatidyltransferase family protein [Rubrivirga sp. F394]MDT7856661.1 CDP-alcohol phosphatidyltransferase family protein [Rubrivirga sp. S365]
MTEETVAVKRTGEIEEPTNRLFVHPLSRALVAPLARWGVSPNAVSLAGLAFGAGAAVAYARYTEWPFVVLGFALMVVWHVLDGADGQLARLTGKTSEIGKVLDGLCDHGTFVLVYASLAAAASATQGSWVWLWAAAAGASHAVQANAYEGQRYAYDFWVQGKQSARVPTPDEYREETRGATGVAWALGRLQLLYLQIQYRGAAAAAPLRRRLAAAAAAPGGAARVAEAYRATHLAGLRRWNLLSSNYRTGAIAVACLLGSPVYFFAFEAVVLNGVFLALLQMQRRNDRALLARLGAGGAA